MRQMTATPMTAPLELELLAVEGCGYRLLRVMAPVVASIEALPRMIVLPDTVTPAESVTSTMTAGPTWYARPPYGPRRTTVYVAAVNEPFVSARKVTEGPHVADSPTGQFCVCWPCAPNRTEAAHWGRITRFVRPSCCAVEAAVPQLSIVGFPLPLTPIKRKRLIELPKVEMTFEPLLSGTCSTVLVHGGLAGMAPAARQLRLHVASNAGCVFRLA
mmetsp:Transcript_36694/g.96081  ORF Transcript_36694/g.96081 Transcript_36694/m.96081 type:complete len:216 (-) Transcript_36694:400-1047(-)